jgi:hypothetical protein
MRMQFSHRMFANDNATEPAPALATVRQPDSAAYSSKIAAVNARNKEFWAKQRARINSEPALPVMEGRKSWME